MLFAKGSVMSFIGALIISAWLVGLGVFVIVKKIIAKRKAKKKLDEVGKSDEKHKEDKESN